MMHKAALAVVLAVLTWAPASSQESIARERVVLRTSAGDVVVALRPDAAPQHAAQFRELVRVGAFDSVDFFRVVPGFVIQTSEVDYRRLPLTEEQRATVRTLPLELSHLRHRRGMLTMARQDDDPASARTSFSFLLGDAPHLDGKYTVFGQVEGGFDVLEEIARVPRDEDDRPFERIEILKTDLVESAEALSGVYVAGARPVGRTSDPFANPTTRTFFLASVLAMMALSLAAFSLSTRVSPRMLASLSLLTTFVGGFALYVYFGPSTEPNHLHGIAVLVGILAMLKLLGRFEHPG